MSSSMLACRIRAERLRVRDVRQGDDAVLQPARDDLAAQVEHALRGGAEKLDVERRQLRGPRGTQRAHGIEKRAGIAARIQLAGVQQRQTVRASRRRRRRRQTGERLGVESVHDRFHLGACSG